MIWVFEGSPSTGTRRQFIRQFSAYDKTKNPGLLHPFGFAFAEKNAEVFVSSQNANIVVRYEYPNGSLMELPLALREKSGDFLPSTFVANSALVGKSMGLKSVRGVIYEPNENVLYVSDKSENSVKRYAADTGDLLDVISDASLVTPVQMAFSEDGTTLYIGSISGNSVYSWNRLSKQFRTLVSPKNNAGLTQPSGIAVSGKWLYVGSRGTKQILRYDLIDGTPDPAGPFIDNMPDQPEFLLFQ